MQSKSLVEEYMLLANILIAEHLFKYCKDKTVLRAHNDIDEEKKEKLYAFFKKVNLGNIDLSNAKALSQSVERLKQSSNQEILNVLNRKFLTCLTQAKYVTVGDRDPHDYQHYGLNFPLYTHFTSPIRRYADLLVHRLLTISLTEREQTRQLIAGIDYAHYADLCSEKSYNARRAGKACQRLFHCLLLKQEGPKVFECLIFDVDARSISVYIEEINIHHVLKLKDDSRVDTTMLFDDELKIACTFKEPLMLADGLLTYNERKLMEKANAEEQKTNGA